MDSVVDHTASMADHSYQVGEGAFSSHEKGNNSLVMVNIHNSYGDPSHRNKKNNKNKKVQMLSSSLGSLPLAKGHENPHNQLRPHTTANNSGEAPYVMRAGFKMPLERPASVIGGKGQSFLPDLHKSDTRQ